MKTWVVLLLYYYIIKNNCQHVTAKVAQFSLGGHNHWRRAGIAHGQLFHLISNFIISGIIFDTADIMDCFNRVTPRIWTLGLSLSEQLFFIFN